MFLSPPVHCYIALKDFAAPWIRYGEEGGEFVDQDGAVAFLNKLGLTKEECEDRRYVFVGLHSISYEVPGAAIYVEFCRGLRALEKCAQLLDACFRYGYFFGSTYRCAWIVERGPMLILGFPYDNFCLQPGP
jgi:hypothetical protein